MTAFFGGIVFGALFAAGIAILFINHMRPRRHRRDVIEWTEQAYQPPVSTRILIKERELKL